jgi:hypothetical protein
MELLEVRGPEIKIGHGGVKSKNAFHFYMPWWGTRLKNPLAGDLALCFPALAPERRRKNGARCFCGWSKFLSPMVRG